MNGWNWKRRYTIEFSFNSGSRVCLTSIYADSDRQAVSKFWEECKAVAKWYGETFKRSEYTIISMKYHSLSKV